MTQAEYEQKKRERWEEFWDEISGNIDFAPGVDDRMKEHIYDTFDRAYSLGKQERDAEETSLCERQTDTSLKGKTMDKDEKFKPVEYEPIGCKNYPDIMDALGAQLTRKYERPYYDKRSETIKETLI